MKFKVQVIESERGWGQKVDEVRTFATYEEAAKFRDSINSQNTLSEVPDIYWRASDPVEVR
jgi:hypothetical protein